MRRFLGEHREGLLRVIESGTFFTRTEIEPLLDASLPGMAELAALLAINRLLGDREFDEVVVDTAPIGHTLRMFEIPQHLAKVLSFLETASARDQAIAAQFAGRKLNEPPVISDWRRMVERVREVIGGPQSRVILVTTTEEFALEESWRVLKELGRLRIEVDEAVLNRAVTDPGTCARCIRRARESTRAIRNLRAHISADSIRIGVDPGGPILGADSLAVFGAHIFEGRALTLRPEPPKITWEPELLSDSWPDLQVPLTLVLGKGGVGKTTISAGLAVHERGTNSGQRVTVCSIDPALSLNDVFKVEVGDRPRSVLGDSQLQAVGFDAVSAFRVWADGLKDRMERALTPETGGLHFDLSFDRRIISALLDVTPPGIDEIFAVFRIVELARGGGRVVIDMAPTGHALEVLRTPARLLSWARLLLKSLAAHRTLALAQDAAVEVATISQRVREFSAELNDPTRSRAWPVMLPESLPDRETTRLVAGLREANLPLAGVFVNRVLFPRAVARCSRCSRARQWQLATMSKLQRKYGDLEMLCVPELPRGIAGKSQLQSFTKRIWRIK